jgi:D-proline reductase (dithiol) PrdB
MVSENPNSFSIGGTRMGDLNEFSLKYKLFLKTYRWRRIDPVPWTPLIKPLKASRVALVSSAGFVTPEQPRFDDAKRGGDTSFREIPFSVDVSTLVESHRSDIFDHSGIRQDPNLAFPIDRLNELYTNGRIGAVNKRHLSLMGSITAPGRLIKRSAPEAVQCLVDDGVDVALLVPV